MTQYLLDTNVISELRKGSRCNNHVANWHRGLKHNSTWLSVVVVAEIRRGIEQIRRKDPVQSSHLEAWFTGLQIGYSSRILPIDSVVANRWGLLNANDRMSYMDGFLAATALEHDLVLATRNISDIKNCGVKYLNPFEP